jgi:hypothetical protein
VYQGRVPVATSEELDVFSKELLIGMEETPPPSPPQGSDEDMKAADATGNPQQQYQGAFSSTSATIAGDTSIQTSSAISISLFNSSPKGAPMRRKSEGAQGAGKRTNESNRRKSHPQPKQKGPAVFLQQGHHR